MSDFLGILYLLAAAGLSVYGLLGLVTLGLYWRHRRHTPPPLNISGELPPVTVQLPVYNERYVVDRLISAAVQLDYPSDRLQIQVIDDSTDDTTQRAAALVNQYKRKGVNISLLHRRRRDGFKAGALAEAMAQCEGEFIAIFDADFQPSPDFLRQTVPYFLDDPQLGVIQARWDHLNANQSPLTAAQAIALDKHFAMEQTVRHRANLFPKFNGAAGVWRRRCMEDAGGWESDTVCEDLCLSTRAVLKGWQFQFLEHVTAAAELPTSISAYKNQQARWAQGSFQCLSKYGKAILRDRTHSVLARLYALLSMSAYATHLLLLILLLLQAPMNFGAIQAPRGWLLVSLAGIGQPMLFVLGQWALHKDWRHRLRHFPTLLLLAIGTAPSNSRAILQAWFGLRLEFVRTPKQGEGRQDSNEQEGGAYRLPFEGIILVELLMAAYATGGLVLALLYGRYASAPFLLSCLLGFGYVSFLGLRELRQA
ncbi:MAG: glycosyltransferase [Anaerolineae bacterium]